MKNLLAAIFILALSFTNKAHSQDVKLSLSEEIKIEKRKLMTGLLHNDESGYYMAFDSPRTLFNSTQDLTLAKYDKKFREIYFKSYRPSENNMVSLGIKYIKDKFIWLQTLRNTKDKTITYYAAEIGLDGKAKKPKKIAKIKYKRLLSIPEVVWQVSQDSTRIAFIAEMDRDSRKENYKAYYSVLDNELNVLWKKTVSLDESQKQVSTESYVLSDNNEIFITSRIYDSNKSAGLLNKLSSKNVGYDSYVLKVNGEGMKRFKLKLEDKFIKGFRIQQSRFDQTMVCVAMIGDSRNGPIQGMSYFSLDPQSGTVKFAKNRIFTDKELDKFGRKNTSKDRRSNEKGLDDEFIFRDIIYRKDGSFMIIAEEYFVRVISTTDANGNTNTTSYFNNNHILVAESDSLGNISNISLIPKKYRASKSGFPTEVIYEEKTHYMFYSILNNGEKVYFLYNDDEKNLKRNITDPDKYKTVTNFRECLAVISHIDENGDIIKKELFTREDTGTLLMPKFSVEINESEIFVFLKRRRLLGKNVFRFGILEVE